MTEPVGTAELLLDAAETLFAAEGIEGASLRSIMRAAGANPAAVHYHYGSREDLARGVLDRVLEPLQAHRLELLDTAVARAEARSVDGPDLRDLVDALVRPDFEAVVRIESRNAGAGRLIGAVYLQPSAFVRSQVEASFAPVAARFMPHLVRALPTLASEELSWRVRWVVFGVLGARLSDDETAITTTNLERELALTARALAGALLAPATNETQPKEETP
jgi:AcrR family transcriptional regulator